MKTAVAMSAAIAIAAGAFGAHGASEQSAEWLKTGASYQLIHAVAAFAMLDQTRRAALILLTGSFVFAGTLYLMALGFPRWLGAITPIGGAVMIGGWLWVAYRALRQRSEQ